ncbi:MAG: hypothetical protein DLM69_02940, partial [Candidatus Chloroheliales bacterium]
MQAPAQGQTRLNHIPFVCFWILASLALIIYGLFVSAAPVSRPITFERSPAVTTAPAVARGYGQPAPKANSEAISSGTNQSPPSAATSLLQASTPLVQAPFHTLQAAVSDKLAEAPTATATAVPPLPSQPNIVAVAVQPSRPGAATPRAVSSDNRPIATARSEIIALLAQRQQAVNNLDGDSFINTVDPQANTLRQEQTIWFADLRSQPTSYYALELGGLSLSGSDRAVGTLTERSQAAGRGVRNVSAEVVFVKRDGQWYYADLNFETMANEHFRIHFFASNRAIGNALFSASQRTYAQVTTDLGTAPAGVMDVKLYPSEDLLQDSVMLTLPQWVGGWSMPGQS